MADQAKRQPQIEWVYQILGVDVGGKAVEALLRQRLQICQDDIRGLKQDEVAADLAAKAGRIDSILSSGDKAAASLIDVLETEIAAAVKAARGQQVEQEAGHHVAFGKLRIRWVQAQSITEERMRAFGEAFLNDPDVRQDPRFEDVEEIVPTLVDHIPAFGEALQEALDELDRMSPGSAMTDAIADARALIEDYTGVLEGASDFVALSDLAGEEYQTDLAGELIAALHELDGALDARG